MNGFRVLLADPPWSYDKKVGSSAACKHYPTLSLQEIKKFRLPDLTDDAVCFLWVTNSFLPKGFEVLDSWGFQYKTCITWVKPCMGLGNYVRNATEHMLLGVRSTAAQAPERLSRRVLSWFIAQRGRHSEKPEHQYWLIEKLYRGPYVELFARKHRVGWTSFGDELE